jgi:hypothetical protein
MILRIYPQGQGPGLFMPDSLIQEGRLPLRQVGGLKNVERSNAKGANN